MYKRIFLAILILSSFVAGAWVTSAAPPAQGILLTATPSPSRTVTRTPTPCPTVTPLQPARNVEPVTSPTDQLSQVITVFSVTAGEVVTATLETGTFTAVAGTVETGRAFITVPLNPNTTHHVRVLQRGFSGSTTCNGRITNVSTTIDKNGNPLTIVQQASTPVPAPTCQVGYSFQSQWGNGFVADVMIKNIGATTITGWALAWTFPGNQQITNMWNASYTQSGANVTARDADWNKTIAPGATASFGFQASFSGTNNKPTAFTLNGNACALDPTGVTPSPSPTRTRTPTFTPTPTRTRTPTPTPTNMSGALPDLVIDDFWLHPERPCFDPLTNPLGARLIVRNAGTADAGPFNVDINGTRLFVSAGLAVGQTVILWAPVANPSNSAFVDSTNLVVESNESNNQITRTFPTATPPPTCTPTPSPTRTSPPVSASVGASAASVQVGQTVVVTASSTLGIPQYRLTVIDTATGMAQSVTNPIFTPAQPAPISVSSGGVSWTLTAVRPGTVRFAVNVNGETFDTGCGCFFFTNASATSTPVTVTDPATPTPTPPSGPDLVVTEVAVVWGGTPIGTAVPAGTKINVKVRNAGSAAAGAFAVTLTAGSSSPQRISVSGLAAGQETTLAFNYQGGMVVAFADADNQVTESNETNNMRSANIPIP